MERREPCLFPHASCRMERKEREGKHRRSPGLLMQSIADRDPALTLIPRYSVSTSGLFPVRERERGKVKGEKGKCARPRFEDVIRVSCSRPSSPGTLLFLFEPGRNAAHEGEKKERKRERRLGPQPDQDTRCPPQSPCGGTACRKRRGGGREEKGEDGMRPHAHQHFAKGSPVIPRPSIFPRCGRRDYRRGRRERRGRGEGEEGEEIESRLAVRGVRKKGGSPALWRCRLTFSASPVMPVERGGKKKKGKKRGKTAAAV